MIPVKKLAILWCFGLILVGYVWLAPRQTAMSLPKGVYTYRLEEKPLDDYRGLITWIIGSINSVVTTVVLVKGLFNVGKDRKNKKAGRQT